MPLARLVTLGEALRIAELVTPFDYQELKSQTSLEKLDAALATPEQGFGDIELYPTWGSKAAIVQARINEFHAFQDANHRASMSITLYFAAINGLELDSLPENDELYRIACLVDAEKGFDELEDFYGNHLIESENALGFFDDFVVQVKGVSDQQRLAMEAERDPQTSGRPSVFDLFGRP